MIYLLLAICFNASLTILFKVFGRHQIDTLPAIVVNYFVCFITGIVVTGGELLQYNPTEAVWIEESIFMGALFILGFNIIAKTVQYYGVGITTIMQKMSLIFVVVYAIFAFDESVSTLKILALTMALVAVVLINWPKYGKSATRETKYILLPLSTWVISGIIDSMFVHVSKHGIATGRDINFVAYLFLIAGILGLIVLIARNIRLKRRFRRKDLIAGIILGIPNFFSVFFIMKMLDIGWEGSVIFPVNNIGILIVSVLAGIWLFKEELSNKKMIGFILSILAIAVMAYTQLA